MMARLKNMKEKRQFESILMVCVLVATAMVVVFPLTAPKVKGQYIHDLGSAQQEDGGPNDGDGIINNIVVWANDNDHFISNVNYIVESGYTLDIQGLPVGFAIYFQDPAVQLTVDRDAKLITHNNGDLFSRTQIIGTGIMGFDIVFNPDSEGRIVDCEIQNTLNGVSFNGAKLMAPGIEDSFFNGMGAYGLQMNNAMNYTNMARTTFDDSATPSATLMDVRNGSLNLTSLDNFIGHSPITPCVYISNANVTFNGAGFHGWNMPGNTIIVEGASNGTSLIGADFQGGLSGEYYVKSNGASFLMDNCSFYSAGPSAGALTLEVHDYDVGWPAHVILRNPMNTTGVWENSSIDATGDSSITLQWWLDVYVQDPDGNLIDFSMVNVSAPTDPLQRLTDASGFARWFLVTELIELNLTRTSYDPFNISALNNSIWGYADPQPNINMSKTITITVPFNPIPNTPVEVISIPTPQGIQFGNITIQFMLTDPDPGDNGILYVNVFWSLDNSSWNPATALPGSQTSNLFINTLYNFYWDSKTDFPDYTPTMYIRVEPFDGSGPGVTMETGSFEVDNLAPFILTPPIIIFLANDTATIEWTVDENANPTVWYGLDDTATNEQNGTGPAQLQTVVLTGLIPGRKYTYYANSTDIYGNKMSTDPVAEVFYTPVHIPLNKGWNLISLPPDVPDPNLANVLAPIAGQYDAVQWYDPSDLNGDYWKHNKTGKTVGNDLDIVTYRTGLWIHMINATLFVPVQNVPVTGGPANTLPMYAGWNLVGYPSSIKQDVPSALGSLDYDVVMTYNAASGRWLRYEKGTGGNLAEMVIGHGYYIHMLSTETWNVDYA
jgi:hypothetical protein